MASGPDVYERLTTLLEHAAEHAFRELFNEFPETFYYCTLATSGEALCPIVSAWSYEALDRESSGTSSPKEEREILKWSYADSPFCGYGEKHFEDIERLFNEIVVPINETSEKNWQDGIQRRMIAMEKALSNIDRKGIFGTGSRRAGMVVVLEVMPPDNGNAERAKRLNGQTEILREYLSEAI